MQYIKVDFARDYSVHLAMPQPPDSNVLETIQWTLATANLQHIVHSNSLATTQY